jgi:hypothetical protein
MNCFADQARYVPEAGCDAAVMRRAGGEVDMRRQLVQDDHGNHRAVLLGGAAAGGGTGFLLIVASHGSKADPLRIPAF